MASEGQRMQLPKMYLRIDPNVDRTKADVQWAFIRLLCEANRQPRRGRFKNRTLFENVLGKPVARKLIAAGDVTELRSGEIVVGGWDDWQEGDVTVAERQRRIRQRRAQGLATGTPPSPDRDTAVTSPLPDRIPAPSSTSSRGSRGRGVRAKGEGAAANADGTPAGLADLPDRDDPVTEACRYLPDGGRWLADDEYRAAWDDLVRRFGDEWVLDELPLAYDELVRTKQRVKAWDLKKATEFRLAERTRAEELAASKARTRAESRANGEHQRAIAEATPEQREQAAYQKRAITLAVQRGIQVPTDATEVRAFVLEHEPGFTPGANA